MSFFKYLFIAFSSVLWCTEGLAGSLSKKVDSIYNHMSDSERLSQLVWVQASSPDKLSQGNMVYGGYYFDKPLAKTPDLVYGSLAVQLDARLNPIPTEIEGLPNLYTLAAITQSDLLSTYFYYLKSRSMASGIDYLILPDVEGASIAQQSLISKMEAFDPDYFKRRSELSFEEAKRKKEIRKVFGSSEYWVIDEEHVAKVEKSLGKHADKVELSRLEFKIKEVLATRTRPEEFIEKRSLPNQLAVELSKASIIPLQREHDMLPISSDTICLLTNDPYSAIADMLRRYAYVITSIVDMQKSNAPVIIDNDAALPDGVLSHDRMIIFVGDLNNSQKWVSVMDAALIYTLSSDIYSYVIPQQLFGAAGASGVFPIHTKAFSSFDNSPLISKDVLGYAPPEMTGLDQMARDRIASIVNEAIQTGSAPGCQIAVAVGGAIVLDEAYGYLTYDSLVPVERSTMFDVASVTKVSATLLAVMKLYENGQLDLDKTLGYYLPEYENSNKKDVTIRAILSHNAGLRPYVPFWQKAISPERMEIFYYETEADAKADKRSYGMKPKPVLRDSLENWILQSSLLKYDSVPYYSYSDIGFMILHQVVEEITQLPLDVYLEREYYSAMGLKRLAFNPRDKGFDLFEIAPTEYDYYFRNELVWGEVHDRNAAVFGGVAGHAGLFSNAESLLVILQTMLQQGRYRGKQFLSPATIDYFNHRYYPNNRRALGWDKKDELIGNVSRFSSDYSFGHTGFTGTMVWVDPTFDLVFVFLSNRIYPDSNNQKLIQKNIRTRIQDVVYEAILAKWTN